MTPKARQLFDLAVGLALEGILRSALWLLRAEELPRLPAGSLPLPPPSRKYGPHRTRAREYQLLKLLKLNRLLGYVLGSNPATDELICDRRWRQ